MTKNHLVFLLISILSSSPDVHSSEVEDVSDLVRKRIEKLKNDNPDQVIVFDSSFYTVLEKFALDEENKISYSKLTQIIEASIRFETIESEKGYGECIKQKVQISKSIDQIEAHKLSTILELKYGINLEIESNKLNGKIKVSNNEIKAERIQTMFNEWNCLLSNQDLQKNMTKINFDYLRTLMSNVCDKKSLKNQIDYCAPVGGACGPENCAPSDSACGPENCAPSDTACGPENCAPSDSACGPENCGPAA